MTKTALLVIDMQIGLVSGAYRQEKVLSGIASVTAKARAADIPTIYVQHNHATYKPMMKGQEGWKLHSAVSPQPGDIVLEKTASDAFHETQLLETLQRMNIDTILVCGMQTEYCVDATCRAALNHGLDVALLSDCHTTGDATISAQAIIDHHNATLQNLAHPSHSIRCVKSSELEI